jgi:hypothetical protein
MNSKLKKIIAREGLIILSILAVSMFFYIIDKWVKDNKLGYKLSAVTISLVKENGNQTDKKMRMLLFVSSIEESDHDKLLTSEFLNITIQFPAGTPKGLMEKTIRRDFPHIKKIDWITWKYSPTDYDRSDVGKRYDLEGNPVFESAFYNINYLEIYMGILFLAYPLYLIGRFVIWSVKTLRKK